MLRTNVNEMNVESIDLSNEVWYGFQFRLALAPVVVCSPIAREFLHRRELHALRCVRDQFSLWPFGRVDTSSQIGEFRVRKIELKRTNRGFVCLWLCSGGLRHEVLLLINSRFRFCNCLGDG